VRVRAVIVRDWTRFDEAQPRRCEARPTRPAAQPRRGVARPRLVRMEAVAWSAGRKASSRNSATVTSTAVPKWVRVVSSWALLRLIGRRHADTNH
jgi:hypothetical protein